AVDEIDRHQAEREVVIGRNHLGVVRVGLLLGSHESSPATRRTGARRALYLGLIYATGDREEPMKTAVRCALLVVACTVSTFASVIVVKPEDVGLSSVRLQRITDM